MHAAILIQPSSSFSKAAYSFFSASVIGCRIMLCRCEINELHLEVWKRMYAMQEAGQSISNSDQFRFMEELGPKLAQQRRYGGDSSGYRG
jgi:hypothetical protein